MAKKISLTVDERIILHLMEFIPNEEDFEAPEGTTQAGIAKAVGIQRKHVPRAVKKLMTDELLTTRVSHVKGGKQRKKVYFLTFEGKAYSRRIWESLAKKPVVLREETGKETETTFSELCFTYQVGKTPVELLLGLQEGNVYSPHKVSRVALRKERKEEKKKGEIREPREIYKKALKVAWEDSILTKDEAALLKDLRDSLNISEQEHRDLQEEIIGGKLDYDKDLSKAEIYRKIVEVALKDGKITNDEQDILDELERLLGLNEKLSTKIKMEMKLLEGEGILTSEKRQANFKDIYTSVMKESMRDGRISRDEQNIILLLKKLLRIEDGEHLEIYEGLKTK